MAEADKAIAATFNLTCPVHVLRPAVFREEEKKVLVYDGSAELVNIPAEISANDIRLQVEPARFPHETVPAAYKEVVDVIEVERERTELYAIPATYRDLTRNILIQEGHKQWKSGCLAPQGSTCIEQVAPQHERLAVKMVDTPARTEQRRIPAQTVQVKRKVLLKPGQGTGIPIPATYQTVTVKLVSKPWQIKTTPVPSRYQTLKIQRKLRAEKEYDTPGLCTEKSSPQQIRLIQQQLQAAGYPAVSSGKLDTATWQAILSFQQDNGLALGGITLETLRKLGLT